MGGSYVAIKSLAELRDSDVRSLAFSPLGLGGQMRPEDSAEFHQRTVARHVLVPEVAEGTRQSFDQLREIYAYGVLCYPIYTMVGDNALLVFEQALRDRFLSYYQGQATFAHQRTGQVLPVEAIRFEQIRDFAASNPGFQLKIGSGPDTMPFNAMLSHLVTWARKVGPLRGQRNRAVERAITQLRNSVAHPADYHLTTPPDAAGTVSNLAEIINHLWGATTPGGHLYPAPAERDIIALIWDEAASMVMSGVVGPDGEDTGGGSPSGPDPSGWTWMLVLGVASDPDLVNFDARYEKSRHPADWLWGPGTAQEAQAWLAEHQPARDNVDILDRVFLLRYLDRVLYLPQHPDIAAAADEKDKTGTWYLIRADDPTDAFSHQRQALAGGSGCQHAGSCTQCRAETLGHGNWDDVIAQLAAHGVSPHPRHVPDVRTPSRRKRLRYIRILDGCWDIPEQEA